MRHSTALLIALALAGCGNDALPEATGDMAGAAAPKQDMAAPDLSAIADLAIPPDFSPAPQDFAFVVGPPNGVMCGAGDGGSTCAVGEVCCEQGGVKMPQFSCGTSCADGGITISCDGPEDCGGNPCCIQATFNGGLKLENTGTCDNTDSCTPMASLAGLTTRRCHSDAECGGNAKCCAVNYNGFTGEICADQTLQAFGQMFGITCQ